MLLMFNTALPVFVMTTPFGEELEPIVTTENDRFVGLNETAGPPVPLCRMIETLFELLFATARSRKPSLLKSPTAAAAGLAPVWKSFLAWKLPFPFPRKTETLFVAWL